MYFLLLPVHESVNIAGLDFTRSCWQGGPLGTWLSELSLGSRLVRLFGWTWGVCTHNVISGTPVGRGCRQDPLQMKIPALRFLELASWAETMHACCCTFAAGANTLGVTPFRQAEREHSHPVYAFLQGLSDGCVGSHTRGAARWHPRRPLCGGQWEAEDRGGPLWAGWGPTSRWTSLWGRVWRPQDKSISIQPET